MSGNFPRFRKVAGVWDGKSLLGFIDKVIIRCIELSRYLHPFIFMSVLASSVHEKVIPYLCDTGHSVANRADTSCIEVDFGKFLAICGWCGAFCDTDCLVLAKVIAPNCVLMSAESGNENHTQQNVDFGVTAA